MRIAVNCRFLLPHRMEGIGRFTWEVARRLAVAHPEHEFVWLFDRPFDSFFLKDAPPNLSARVVHPPARHPALWYVWFEWALPWALQRCQADVFLSPDGYCSLRSRVPTVMVAHDLAHLHFPEAIPPLVRRYYDYFVPRYLRRAERVVAVSAFTAQDIAQQYGIASGKITIACNGCAPVFCPLSEARQQAVREQYAQGAPYFFYIGAMHPRKNVERLVVAFDQFKAHSGSPLKLLLAGRLAWQTGALQQALEQAQHRQDIVLLGYVPDKDLPLLTGAAFAFVYVSLLEGFGVPVLEAMHCDVPLLCARAAALPEVAGEAALYVDPYSVESIAKGMTTMWEDAALRHKLVRAGRLHRQQFSWERATHVVWDAIAQAMYS